MGRLRFGPLTGALATIFFFLFVSACGKSKPAPASPFPARITLNPSTSFSLQLGSTIQLSATAQNNANSSISTAFTFSSSNPGILDIAPNGTACAGTWNAPAYTLCTPAGIGVAQVTASALGATSAPTQIFVHAPIDNIQISIVPPVNSPPPACPGQQALPAACNISFTATNLCLSQGQTQTLQATAFSQGVDITASVGPFAWSKLNSSVLDISPIVTSSTNIASNQASVSPNVPGQTQVVASTSGVSSQPYNFETCPVQCIALEVGVNGSQRSGDTSFVINKGTSETITATAVDVQGCIVPKPPLTWVSSAPAALTAGSATTGCAAGTTCTFSTPQPGAASITASCTPPTCNIGFPSNPAGYAPPFIPQPVYPVTAISGLVTGATTSTSVLATSRDCYSDPLCSVGLYNVSTSTNLPGGVTQLSTAPNSLLFDPAGDKAYEGSEFGAAAINPANLGGSSNPFTFLPAPGTPLGLVTGTVLAVSQNGSQAIFSDTLSTPNQIYVVNTASTSATTVALNINNASAAAFSPDELKAFILGNAGKSLYIYSRLQPLSAPISLPSPATSIAFSSTGAFALLAGGASPSNLAIYNTCDNSSVSLPVPGPGLPIPPVFLMSVPAGNVPMGNTLIPIPLDKTGLDFFFGVDDTGIDIIATVSSLPPVTTLCPQQVSLPANFAPTHINIGQGTFHPTRFFLSPDTTQAYIVTSDFGILIYNFNTNAVSKIPLVDNATALAADITVDGTLLYVAGSDGLLHVVSTNLSVDQTQISFSPLPNSPNSFCFTGLNCSLNLVAVKP